MGRKKKTLIKAIISSPIAAEAVERQQKLWEKYHGNEWGNGDNKHARVVKIFAKEPPRNASGYKKRKSTQNNLPLEASEPDIEKRMKELDATRGTHIYRDQKWFGGLSSFDNYSDDASS